MYINRRFFPSILLDNDSIFLSHLEGVIDSVDEYSSLEIVKAPNAYHFRLASSEPKYNPMLLQEILKLHTFFKIRVELSKSIKASGTINFAISLNN